LVNNRSFSWAVTSCVITLAVALISACGGGEDDPVLHLAGQDVKESTVRKYIREEFNDNQSVYGVICRTVRAVSDALTAFLARFPAFDASEKGKSLEGVKVEGQKGDEASMRRLGAILLEECERAFP
jgi:hypothetical protein